MQARLVALRSRWLLVAASGALCALLSASPARADDAQTARARELFQEGMGLETGGDFQGALKRFREVAAVKKTPQVLFHIALCQEKIGQLTEALEGYRQASSQAGKDPKLAEVKRTVDSALSQLEPRVPSLTIKRGKGARAATIVIDGQKLEADATTEPVRLNPGKHLVQARAKGKENFRAELTLAEGEQKELEIKLGDLDDGSPGGDEPGEAKKTAQGKGEGNVLPYVIGGIGLASLGASGVFYALRSSAEKDLQSQCVGSTCPTSAHPTWEKARNMNSLSNVTLGVGVAGLGVAAAMLLFGGGGDEPSSSTKTATARLRVDASPNLVGANLAGTF